MSTVWRSRNSICGSSTNWPSPGRRSPGTAECGAATGSRSASRTPSTTRSIWRRWPGSARYRCSSTGAADGEVGLFGLRSKSVIPGYWNDADTYYRSKLAGYWLSGDLAYRKGEDFFHVDRAVDTIHTPEGPGYSVLMEEILLLALPEAADCAVAAGGRAGVQVPVAVVRAPADADPAELLARANAALREAGQPPLALLETALDEAAIPTGPTGKVLKRKLRERYADLDAYTAEATGRFATETKAAAAR